MVKLSKLHNEEGVTGVAIAIPIAAMEEVSARFENTLYRYIIRKRLAFPLVETYVKNTWAKYGIERVMLHSGFFFFQFATSDGMERVIESGPWLIRLVPLILNIWTPNSKLRRDAIAIAPLWVKLHNVPIAAYTKTGLSLITSQLGRPIMLDSYTSNMCLKSWGRNTYVRALIEVSSEKELIDSLVVAIPFPNGTGHTLETIEVEYEWEPPRCDSCKNFDHNNEHCPKKAKDIVTEQTKDQNKDNGFTRVSHKRGKGNYTSKNKQVAGIKLNKPNLNLYYHPVAKSIPKVGETSSKQPHGDVVNQGMQDTQGNIKESSKAINIVTNDSDSEEVEEVVLEEPIVHKDEIKDNKGTSNPSVEFPHGSRIILGWNPNDVDMVTISQDAQVMHTRLWFKADKKVLFCSFIYAHNSDFNAALNLADHSAGPSTFDISMREFKDCVEDIEVSDVNHLGLRFTWNQKPQGDAGTLKKIDRVMASLEFNDDIVRDGWSRHVSGFYMFQVVKKLKFLKKPLRKLLYDKGNVHLNVKRLRTELDRVQIDLDLDPFNLDLREEEACYVKAFNDALLMEERFLQQKAKIDWLKASDFKNTRLFPQVGKGRISRSRIDVVSCLDGSQLEGDQGIVSNDVTRTVKEFFTNGTLLKELNHTIIALIPKIASPSHINDYRPKSCCNVMYKCISKILSNRIKDSLKDLVSLNQSAFVRSPLGKCGLHQGDPLSPYLFTLIMEVFTLMLQRRVRVTQSFTYHQYCSKLDLINLCFADDLFLFAYGDADSARVIMDKGRMPVKYLGVPLILTRLVYRGCKELIEKASVFILPTRILLDLKQLMRGFLWCQGDIRKRKAKVAWDVVCLPKKEGGLGIRKLDVFNKALMISHIWSLLNRKESLWVRWIHAYKLNGRSFWNVPFRGNMTWGWRKVLQLRPMLWQYVWYKIGDGSMVSLWHDRWDHSSPLSDIVSSRDIHRAGLNMGTMIKESICNGQWRWSSEWSVKYPSLAVINVPSVMPNMRDSLEWRVLGLPTVSSSLNAIVDAIIARPKRRSVRGIIARLVFAALTYFIWEGWSEKEIRLGDGLMMRSMNMMMIRVKSKD
ncbi:hypothetical protein Tco_0033289 [Tanacetum coccineum]